MTYGSYVPYRHSLANGVVAVVRHVDVARAVHRHTREDWSNRAALPVPSALPEASADTSQRRHHSAGGHLANGVLAESAT